MAAYLYGNITIQDMALYEQYRAVFDLFNECVCQCHWCPLWMVLQYLDLQYLGCSVKSTVKNLSCHATP